MAARTEHDGDVRRRRHTHFHVIVGAALLALALPACDGDSGAAPTANSAPTVEPTVAPTSTIGTPITYAGQATYVTGTLEDFSLDQGTVTYDDDGASHSRDGILAYTMISDDPRVSGTLTGTWNSDRWGELDHGALVQWGDVVLTNDNGTWEGPYTGAYASDYGGDVVTRWTVGTGAYEGLTFYFWLTYADGAQWYGIIYPGEPPPNVLPNNPSEG